MTRILNARDTYYRIWLSRPERMAVNLWRALGISDQPPRFGYNLRRTFSGGPNLKNHRTLEPLN